MDEFKLDGIAVYNPRLLSKDELCSSFCVRHELLERLVEDLRRATPGGGFQHRLILGQRGMGKTTLLHRLRFAIEDDEDLDAVWLPLVFPEEQYNVADLSGLWLNCLDAVADALESHGEDTERIDSIVEQIRQLPRARRADATLTALQAEAARLNRRLILLIDNIDLVLDRIGKEQWTLRKILSDGDIALIGASAHASETTYQYDRAFFDFFGIEELTGLSLGETRTLLSRLADRADRPEVRKLAEDRPERIEPIRVLTGGNPRTVMLLFMVLSTGVTGSVRSDLEKLLDLCTPLYKHRFEVLSEQAQRIVAGLCAHWHPIGSRALAEQLDIKSTTVSSQLERLCKAGVTEKVPLANEAGLTRKTGYQIAERFFNIWYLMRNSRRLRRRLMWFVEFLRIINTPEERRSAARQHLATRVGGLRDAETGLALAMTVDDPILRSALEHTELSTRVEYKGGNTPVALLLAEQCSTEPLSKLTIATNKLETGGFSSAEHLIREVFSDLILVEGFWSDVVSLLQRVVSLGYAQEAATLLEEMSPDRWLPVRVALLAAGSSNRDILSSVAPEVRAVATPLFEHFSTPWGPEHG